MNRRRFLVLIGGVGGALAVDSYALAETLALEDSLVPVIEPIVIDPGFVDATVWDNKLVTLRPDSLGIILRFENEARNIPVPVPDGFGAKCVGVHSRYFIVAGYRTLEDPPVHFKAESSYRRLLEVSGEESSRLSAQPSPPPQPTEHTIVAQRYRPAVYVTVDFSEWKLVEIPNSEYPGGVVGAFLEREGVVAVSRYVDDQSPDSSAIVELLDLADALRGVRTVRYPTLDASHGSLWGVAQDASTELVVVVDFNGTRASTVNGQNVFDLPRYHRLLAANSSDQTHKVAFLTPSGERKLSTIGPGGQTVTETLDVDTLIEHGVSPDIIVASRTGFTKTILQKPNRQLDRNR